MKCSRKHTCLALVFLLIISLSVYSAAETEEEKTEQGLEELQPLIEMTEIGETEGLSLEEMTDIITESVMSEYHDSITGFSMQYPSVFQFEESGDGTFAATADGKAVMMIENMPNEGNLNEEDLIKAIRLEIPDAQEQKNEQNGCLRFDRHTDGGAGIQTDLYYLTGHSFHHIVLRYPEEEQDTYHSYIEYMINSMETNETDLG